jgi:hypothetical protein
MSHPSNGYFYCRYTYTAYWDSSSGTGCDADFHTAYYTPAKNDHKAQTDWYNNVFKPEAQADCERIINNFHGNLKGRIYRPFDWNMYHRLDFMWTNKLPVHTQGPRKGLPFGRKI